MLEVQHYATHWQTEEAILLAHVLSLVQRVPPPENYGQFERSATTPRTNVLPKCFVHGVCDSMI